MNPWIAEEGTLDPPGVYWDEAAQAWNFTLYSRQAQSLTLLLYGDESHSTPLLEFEFDLFKNRSGPVWHCRIPKASAPGARFYAYRASGPIEGIDVWHAFDEKKLLLDPYAKAVYFPPQFNRSSACRPGDNAGKAALGVIDADREFDWQGDQPIQHGHDLVVYEMHVRGFTRNPNSGVAAPNRGKFEGIIEKIPYLVELGVTAVEFMPVFQFDPHEGNYWGYMPLNFFAPHSQFAAIPEDYCHQRNEFREMVRQLHKAGIEVLLDVVFNHTCEGDETGPTYSFKGIDSGLYYTFSGDELHPYANYTGCGNTLNAHSVAVQKLVVESLKYWTKEMHVDGFRFDLASIFARRSDGSIDNQQPPIFGQLTSAFEGPITPRLIAEPWDAAGLYQLGRSFPGWLWMQWNGAYRDTMQRFVAGESGLITELMTRLYGSRDLFPDDEFNSCRPWQSINYISSHDGSPLYDLASFEEKSNWANGEDNRDGPHEFRFNCGWEGDTNVPAKVMRLRRQQVKNYFTLLFLSNGTPMFRMGDEFMQTQDGNNNPYNQDNETSWLDWTRLEQNRDVFRFVKEFISFRKTHSTINRSTFWREDITWYGTGKHVDMGPHSQSLAFCLRGERCGDEDIYVMINGCPSTLHFQVQEGWAETWRIVIDTAAESPEDIYPPGEEPTLETLKIDVAARSIVVLIGQGDRESADDADEAEMLPTADSEPNDEIPEEAAQI
ncbi:glycogen debranching protein [Stratiformator vulcanicus]|uniref:Glycogen debranching enzyme n=1 Tax=Stratiformator vulcanicus TaxID=2527980 RepID=A0A517QX61_9PLAN|nr:isoamylase [Stratiformator vulcanicus]QDT36160.1 Glycogen debranching enzyme [Stratiformator vulcanicus]